MSSEAESSGPERGRADPSLGKPPKRTAPNAGRGTGRARKRRRGRPQEISAGGVVIRGEPGREQTVVIVPTRRAGDGSRVLALPKGHVDPGENAIEAATREVREETGIVAEPVRELGSSRYWYRREGRTVGKLVTFFLFAYLSGDTKDHDDEVLEARWIDLRDALTELSYDGERDMIELALAHLRNGSQED